jgi:hypothetical protein
MVSEQVPSQRNHANTFKRVAENGRSTSGRMKHIPKSQEPELIRVGFHDVAQIPQERMDKTTKKLIDEVSQPFDELVDDALGMRIHRKTKKSDNPG